MKYEVMPSNNGIYRVRWWQVYSGTDIPTGNGGMVARAPLEPRYRFGGAADSQYDRCREADLKAIERHGPGNLFLSWNPSDIDATFETESRAIEAMAKWQAETR